MAQLGIFDQFDLCIHLVHNNESPCILFDKFDYQRHIVESLWLKRKDIHLQRVYIIQSPHIYGNLGVYNNQDRQDWCWYSNRLFQIGSLHLKVENIC